MAGVAAAWAGLRAANPLGPLARAQCAALARVRLCLMLNRLRTSEGALEQGARWAAMTTYGTLGMGIGVAAGWAAYTLIAHGSWEVLPVEFWFVCVLWQTLSVALASFQERSETGDLLRFPVSFGSFFVLSVVATLLTPSTILGVLGSLGILLGATLASPGMFGWSAVSVAAFISFNLLLTRAVLSWVERWLTRRRVREFVGGAFLFLVICLQLLNPAVMPWKDDNVQHPPSRATNEQPALRLTPWVEGMGQVQAWLPPGLEARALEQAGKRHPARAAQTLGVLGFYVVLAGGLLAVRLRADFRGENPSSAATQSIANAPVAKERAWAMRGISGAVVANEFHTLTRSIPLLFVLITPLVMVLVIAGAMISADQWSGYALPVCVAYALLGFTQLMYNNLGVDGAGVQLMLLSPTPLWRLVAAKNLLHGLLYVLVALAAAALALVRGGAAPVSLCAATAAWVVFALAANLAAGNRVSVLLPYRMEHGKLGRQSGSQANGLIGIAIQLMIAGVGAGAVSLGIATDILWLPTVLLLVLGTAAWLAWWFHLQRVDALAYRNRDRLLARLVRLS